MGPAGLRREMETQKMDNYYDLNLSEETNRYIFRLVAIKHVMEHPELYGFDMKNEQMYPPLDNYTLVMVDSSIANLGDFAKQFGTSYRMLKVFNPWLKGSSLTNTKGKTYDIKIPR
jgi:hypothetical protein